MRLQILFLLFALLTSVYGQKNSNPPSALHTPRAKNQKHAANSTDIIDFLIQSQIVEFRTSLNRDPFLPSSNNNAHTNNGNTNTNTQGIFLIDEITILGRAVIQKKSFALILDPLQNAMEISVGFSFLDGELTAITENALVFTQWEAGSPNRSDQRTVTKPFQREEGK